MKRATIYDVAERAGVSKSLVSLVLRDGSRVSDEKRVAVLAAIRELNYTPSRLAAGLAGTRTRSVGVVIDEFSNLWFVEALAGLREALTGGGYSLSVADTRLNAHLDLDPIDAFRSLRVDGLVLAGEASAAAIAQAGVPAVVLGCRAFAELSTSALPASALPEADLLQQGQLASDRPETESQELTKPFHVISSDEVAGGRLAVRHLAQLGHREIVCVSGPGASAAARERGYLEEMAARGFDARVLRATGTSEDAARKVAVSLWGNDRQAEDLQADHHAAAAAQRTEQRTDRAASDECADRGRKRGSDAELREYPKPTAVFAVNDPLAVGVMGAAKAAGVEVPRDLSVVGYDDSPLAGYGLVSLTTISGDLRQLGERAGRLLVALIEGGQVEETGSFQPRLVERDSTRAVGG